MAEQQSQRILDGAIFIIICMEKRRVSSAASLLNNLDPPPGKKTSVVDVDDVEPPLPALDYDIHYIELLIPPLGVWEFAGRGTKGHGKKEEMK